MEFFIKPWQHQLDAIRKSADLNEYALFFEQGCGKTLTCINMMRIKYSKSGRLIRTVIFCPDIVMSNWKKEILENSRLTEDDILINSGSGVMREERIKVLTAENKPKVIIMNIATLRMPNVMQALLRYRPNMFILDESHKCKSATTKTSKGAQKLANSCKYKFLLTGTPILNNLMDVFSQFRILDGGETFGKNMTSFKMKYFVDKNAGMPKSRYFPNWQPKVGAYGAISVKMARKSMVVRKADCLDLPPLVKKTIEFELPPKVRRHYEELKSDFVTYLEDDACVANLAITKALRLQQMASGFIQLDSGKVVKFDDREKVLKELLEDKVKDSKVIVWAVFKENYKTIRKVCDELRIGYVEVNGEVNLKGKDEAVEKFNTCSDTRVYIGHPGSGGIGVNLTASDCSVVFSRTWNLEFELQSEARNYRGGSEIHKRITKYDLVAKDTMDEVILEALQNKEKMSLKVLKGIAREMKYE